MSNRDRDVLARFKEALTASCESVEGDPGAPAQALRDQLKGMQEIMLARYRVRFSFGAGEHSQSYLDMALENIERAPASMQRDFDTTFEYVAHSFFSDEQLLAISTGLLAKYRAHWAAAQRDFDAAVAAARKDYEAALDAARAGHDAAWETR